MGTLTSNYQPSLPSASVMLIAGEEPAWEPQTAVYDIIDDPTPTYAVRGAHRTGTMTLRVEDNASYDKATDLLRSGHGLRLDCGAQPATEFPSFDNIVFVPTSVRVSWATDRRTGARHITVEYRRVTATPPEPLR
jgi:hypothetical protein